MLRAIVALLYLGLLLNALIFGFIMTGILIDSISGKREIPWPTKLRLTAP